MRRALNATDADLRRWRDAGCPCRQKGNGYLYPAHDLAEWLQEQGLVELDLEEDRDVASEPIDLDPQGGPVYTTRAEAARAFGITTQGLQAWLDDPLFPGISGSRGIASANFPAIPIARWMLRNGRRGTIPDGLLTDEQIQAELVKRDAIRAAKGEKRRPESQDRLVSLRADRVELELQRLQGTMVDAEEVKLFFERTCANAKAVLRGLKAKVLSSMPPTLPEDITRRVASACDDVIVDTCDVMAELIEGDKDLEEVKVNRTRGRA